jgi:hypothetical protein
MTPTATKATNTVAMVETTRAQNRITTQIMTSQVRQPPPMNQVRLRRRLVTVNELSVDSIQRQ